MYQKYIGFSLSLIALALFVPGIFLPMFYLNMDMNIAMSGTGINSQLVDKELSIITTITELWQQNRHVVALLIFVFSVVIPIFKTSALVFVFFTKQAKLKLQVGEFIAAIGKWSMADVFVVAIFLAVLSTNHTENAQQHSLSFWGLSIDFEISTQTLSLVGAGFYYFAGYCVVSILSSQLILRAIRRELQHSQDSALPTQS